jgi:hypothetical protein
VTSSNLSFSGSLAWKAQAAYSAKVLLLPYAVMFGLLSTTDQFSSVKILIFGSSWSLIAAELDVITNLLTLDLVHALQMFIVPSTAGLINTFASFGWVITIGDATWITYVHPLTALSIAFSSARVV